jgi:hypothetical protein
LAASLRRASGAERRASFGGVAEDVCLLGEALYGFDKVGDRVTRAAARYLPATMPLLCVLGDQCVAHADVLQKKIRLVARTISTMMPLLISVS